MCVCILRFQSVLASVFVDSNCGALVLSSMSYDRKMNSVFCVHLLTFWSNGWKFRNSLPISKSLRCGSAPGGATTAQMQGRFWGVEKCSKTLPRTKGLHSSAGSHCQTREIIYQGRPALAARGTLHTARREVGIRASEILAPAIARGVIQSNREAVPSTRVRDCFNMIKLLFGI